MNVSTSLLESPEVVEEIKVSDDAPSCECDHGSETEYVPCGDPAAFRIITDCDCGDVDHGKTVRLFCAPCKDTFIENYGAESATILPL